MPKEYKCPHCGGEINPGRMLGQGLTEKKREAIWKNSRKAGRPFGAKDKSPRKKKSEETIDN